MEWFVFQTPEFESRYNCTNLDVNSVPLAQRQNMPLGLAFFTMGTLQFLLYIPCMAAIWKHREHPCYKMMFYMGVLDMLCLPICAIGTGVFGMLGAVYCSSPNLIYVMGVVGWSLWFAETTIELLLAFNRCLDIACPRIGELLFKGRRTWCLLTLPTLYGLYTAWFQRPGVFTSIYFTWILNPYAGYLSDPDAHYTNELEVVHNWIVMCLLAGTYLSFGVVLMVKRYTFRGLATSSQIYSQKLIFLQVVLISTANIATATLYVIMQYTIISKPLMILGQFAWIQVHGIPPVIYLTINKTIRSECANIVLKWLCGVDRQRQSGVLWAHAGSNFPSFTSRKRVISPKLVVVG